MAELVANGTWANQTTWEAALLKAELDPDGIAIWLDDGGTIRYGEAVREARKLAHALAGLGLKPGEVVSANLPNWREMIIINLACCALGLVMNPIIPIYRDHKVSFILKDAGARILFSPGTAASFDYPAMARRLAEAMPALEHVVIVRPEKDADQVLSYETLLAAGRAEDFVAAHVDPSWIKLL